ncbi:MAG: hypothetical protein ACKVS8_07350 [Phycisphaerales bacterium]
MDLIDISRLEERRRAICARDIADSVLEIAGGQGFALRGKPGSWINYAVGFGLAEPGVPAPSAAGCHATWPTPVPREELQRIIAWYESAGIEPRFEVSPLADVRIFRDLADLGCGVRDFTNAMYRQVSLAHPARPASEPPRDLQIRVIDPANDAQVRAYSIVAVSGFKPAGVAPTEDEIAFSARVIRGPRTLAMGAYMPDGPREQLVGAGALLLTSPGDGEPFTTLGGCASLMGLSVLPAFRQRGIQQALIAARLNAAAERRVCVATIGSRPGAGTERNAIRMNFQLAYTKLILTRPGPGLVAVPG